MLNTYQCKTNCFPHICCTWNWDVKHICQCQEIESSSSLLNSALLTFPFPHFNWYVLSIRICVSSSCAQERRSLSYIKAKGEANKILAKLLDIVRWKERSRDSIFFGEFRFEAARPQLCKLLHLKYQSCRVDAFQSFHLQVDTRPFLFKDFWKKITPSSFENDKTKVCDFAERNCHNNLFSKARYSRR